MSEKHHIFVLKLILFKVNLRLSLSFSAVFILVHRVLVAKTDRWFTERNSLKKLMWNLKLNVEATVNYSRHFLILSITVFSAMLRTHTQSKLFGRAFRILFYLFWMIIKWHYPKRNHKSTFQEMAIKQATRTEKIYIYSKPGYKNSPALSKPHFLLSRCEYSWHFSKLLYYFVW